MGLLVEGRWQDKWYETKDGRFERKASSFRDWVTPDGGPGPDGQRGFPAEAGRYHLYVSLACPWAHRTLILRKLKGLEKAISVSVVDFLMGSEGWVFSDRPGAIPDSVNGKARLYEVYTAADPSYTGRVTVPVLWDKATGTIVNNESAEIIRMLNASFDAFGNGSPDLYPPDLRPEIDALNADIYDRVNNGVYKCGFATTQAAYETPFHALFDALDGLEERLSTKRYLLGSRPTEADWRLFTTLVRFDPVYVGHFKCNKRRIADYPNLFGYLRDLYQTPGIAETVNFEHIKGHYYQSHPTINPTGIVPLGPDEDLTAPHGREEL
ncbi:MULTISPECIES: glutathione S-transferase family protein [unclassified Aureimonas]|uniref:glutathione S-transferase family protein n=1 Tax=unclassified Aureimonas TaxID=2615206 RepID=UPI00070053FE|nr:MULTISPECIES: glutathione S-transferase family protein [unclassified Aureimonas]KQT66112.1 glutathionyl-hydroquinone reductase YqjG [Aureimonas sp. Leaf427]KQT81024.1 glutathionyl-hydroquinone reductase YqjG [Aureimonas sp. Leaf460]